MRQQWNAFCDDHGEAIRDPARHNTAFLTEFMQAMVQGRIPGGIPGENQLQVIDSSLQGEHPPPQKRKKGTGDWYQ